MWKPHVEPCEPRLLFSTLCGLCSSGPRTLPEPSLVDGVFSIRGTDAADTIELGSTRNLDTGGSCSSRTYIPDIGGTWQDVDQDPEPIAPQLYIDIWFGACGPHRYQVAMPSIQGVVIEGGAGADKISFSGESEAGAIITMLGGAGNDTLLGGFANEVTLIGGAGRDTLSAATTGSAYIEGGLERDTITGSRRKDVIIGGAGNDVVYAGAGNDTVYGAEGIDFLAGEDGGDVLLGGLGDDVLQGGLGGDHLLGEDGHDILQGDGGDDLLDGGAGTDTLYGNDGNDLLIGGRGAGDSMRGGAGNDRFRSADVLGNHDSMWGEAGFDQLLSPADADDLLIAGPQTR
ncbi:MAG: calcium-binding protein [Tepidisphaeraceae bacterium]